MSRANDKFAPTTALTGPATLTDLAAALRAQPDRMQALLHASADPVIAFDASRKVVCANLHAEVYLGYPRGSLLGRSTDELVPLRLRQPNAPPPTVLADIVRVAVPALRADGTEVPTEWSLVGLPLPRGLIFLAAPRDLQASERAVESLRLSEERQRLILEGIQDYAVLMLDTEGRVVTWNAGAERIKGYTAQEIIGHHFLVLLPAGRSREGPARAGAGDGAARGPLRAGGLAGAKGRLSVLG